jgi:hypothetical protein
MAACQRRQPARNRRRQQGGHREAAPRRSLSRMRAVDFSLPIFVDGGTILVDAKSKLERSPISRERRSR